jgi:hypothetical protein
MNVAAIIYAVLELRKRDHYLLRHCQFDVHEPYQLATMDVQQVTICCKPEGLESFSVMIALTGVEMAHDSLRALTKHIETVEAICIREIEDTFEAAELVGRENWIRSEILGTFAYQTEMQRVLADHVTKNNALLRSLKHVSYPRHAGKTAMMDKLIKKID